MGPELCSKILKCEIWILEIVGSWTIWICTCGKFYYGEPFTLGQTSIWGKFMVEWATDLRCKRGKNWIRQKTSNCIAAKVKAFIFMTFLCRSICVELWSVIINHQRLVDYNHIWEICHKKRLLQSIRIEAADIVYGAKISGGAILLNPFQRTFVLSKNIPVEQKWQICFKPRVLISSTKTWYNLPTISYWLDLFLHNLTANGGARKT